MGNNEHTLLVLYVSMALLFGVGVGYWYGTAVGNERGRSALLVEQQAQEEEEKKKAQEEIAKAANPFEETNPLEGSYQNPFKANVNPFSQ